MKKIPFKFFTERGKTLIIKISMSVVGSSFQMSGAATEKACAVIGRPMGWDHVRVGRGTIVDGLFYFHL